MYKRQDLSRTVFEISQRLSCQWLLIEWGGKTRGNFTVHNPIGWLKSHLRSDLAIFRDAGVRYIRKILILINDDSNDKLALETADYLAEVFWADVTLSKYTHTKISEEKKAYELSYLGELGKNLKSKKFTKIIQGSDKANSVLEYTADYALLILGSGDYGFIESLRGTDEDKIMAKASCSVLAVHKGLSEITPA